MAQARLPSGKKLCQEHPMPARYGQDEPPAPQFDVEIQAQLLALSPHPMSRSLGPITATQPVSKAMKYQVLPTS